MAWRDRITQITSKIPHSAAYSRAELSDVFDRSLRADLGLIHKMPQAAFMTEPLTQQEMLQTAPSLQGLAQICPEISPEEAFAHAQIFLGKLAQEPLAHWLAVQAINHPPDDFQPMAPFDAKKDPSHALYVIGNIQHAMHQRVIDASLNATEKKVTAFDKVYEERIAQSRNVLAVWQRIVGREADAYLLEPDPPTTEDIANTQLDVTAVHRLVGNMGDKNRDKIVPLVEQFLNETLGSDVVARYSAIRAINEMPEEAVSAADFSQMDAAYHPMHLMAHVSQQVSKALLHRAEAFAIEREAEGLTGKGRPTSTLLHSRAAASPENGSVTSR